MSLEAALAANTEALNRLSVLMEASNAGRAEALAAAESLKAAASGEKKTRTKKDEPEAPKTPKVEDYSGDAGIEKVRAVFGEYLGVDDEGERANRTKIVKKIFALLIKGVEKPRAGDIPEASRAQAVQWVKTLIAGEDVAELADEDEGLI